MNDNQHGERIRGIVSKLAGLRDMFKGDDAAALSALAGENLTNAEMGKVASELVGQEAAEQWLKGRELKPFEDAGVTSLGRNPTALASGEDERNSHRQILYDNVVLELDKFKTVPKNLEDFGISGTNVATNNSQFIIMTEIIFPFIDSLVRFYVSTPEFEKYEKHLKVDGEDDIKITTPQTTELMKYWSTLKDTERNVTVRIDESHAKRMDTVTISTEVAKCDWKKHLFHLSDAYTFEFGNKYSFLLTFSSVKESEGFNINYKLLRKLVLDALSIYSKAADHGPTSEAIVAYTKIPKEKRMDFNRFVMQQLKSKFSSSMQFFFEEKLPDHMSSKNGGMVGWLYFNDYSDFEVMLNRGKKPDSRVEGSIINKLLMCLSFLSFSHKREFVTNNKSLTTNQRKAAKGLPLKPEKASYKELTAEKIINIPRKEYFNSMRTKGKGGTHASPKGHDRNKHPRTYRHERFVNMKDKTVWIGDDEGIKVNGGAPEHQKTVYNLNKKSKMVDDFISELEKNKNFPENEK